VEEIVAISVPAKPKAGSAARAKEKKLELAEAAQLQRELEEALDTRVRISGGTRGRIVIDYAGADDLERLATKMTGSTKGLI
jgi:hypothetical protein